MAALTFSTLRSKENHVTAVLSGSAVLQIVLGEDWGNTDVDIFCTQSAVDEVVKHLDDVGCYDVTTDSSPHEEYRLNLSSTILNLHLQYPKIEKVLRYALYRDCNSDTTEAVPVPIRRESEKTDSTKASQAIYFDIVVAQSDVVDARELLQSFDITCCAVYIDTAYSRFHIPDPHLTFQKQSRTNQSYKSLLTGFAGGVQARYYAQGITSPKAIVRHGTGFQLPNPWWLECVKAAVDRCAQSVRSLNPAKTDGTPAGASMGELSTIYDLCSKLLVRQQKYVDRGIIFLTPAPMLADVGKLVWNRRLTHDGCRMLADVGGLVGRMLADGGV